MKYLIPVFIIFLITTGISKGQDTLKLGFDEAVKIALQKNIQLSQEKNNLESANALNQQSKASFLPNISAYSSFSHKYGLQFDPVKAQLYFNGTNGSYSVLTANYTIFNGLGKLNTYKRSENLLESQENQVERTEQQIIFNVAQQYLQVLLDRELLRIAMQNLKVQKTTLQQIEGFVEAGTRPLGDKLNQQAEVKRLEVLQIRAENKLRIDRAILSQNLMMDAGTEIDPIEPDWGFQATLAEDFNVNDLYHLALNNRPDYKKSITDQEAAIASLGIARSYHFPTFSLFVDYGSYYSSQVLDQQTGEKVPFRKQYFKDNLMSEYGLRINIPIFNQYQTIYQKTQARVTLENAKLTEDYLKLTLYREVQNSYMNFLAAKNEYFATQSQYDAAVESNKIQQERYLVGVGDLVELSQATQRYVEAAAGRAQTQYTLLFQKVILDYYTGVLSSDNLH